MTRVWRLIDTGVRRAAENFALNRALLEARRSGASPSTLRFLQFRPSALLGYHQSAQQELDLDYCRANGIDVQRRITGGGAICMDEGQFGWELYLHREDVGRADMAAIARRICEAAARGLSSLGLDARYRPRNDIEVGGRKVSGTGGAFDGDALMYQGTVLVEFDVERMVSCLRIPARKIADKAIADARERVVSLAELLGCVPPLAQVKVGLQQAFESEFAVRFEPARLSPQEDDDFGTALAEIDCDDWVNLVREPRAGAGVVEAARKFPGGLLRASVVWDPAGEIVRQVWFTGDFFVSPRRTIFDLEAALKDAPLARLRERIEGFFAVSEADMLALRPQDFAEIVEEAVRPEDEGRQNEKDV
jgi:lipoate-protein ligase A